MSLRYVSLRDFVIVRALELHLRTGFSVLTGETGAGKSILIDALQLVLGARADAVVVREGATRAEVGVEFDNVGALAPWLDQAGFEPGATLLLRRTVDTQGKSRGWINGSPATATQLREIGEKLVDIHGQHAWQSLTRPDAVRDLLDAYAGIDTGTLQQAWHAWRCANRLLTEARTAQATLHDERERLSWQISELEKLNPGEEEWDELNASHTRLAHAQALIDAAEQAAAAIEDEDSGVLRHLARAIQSLQQQSHLEPEFTAMADILQSSLAQAEDATHTLHAWLRRVDPDPQRLASLDQRLHSWVSLARRFKRSPSELYATLAQWRADIARLEAASDLETLTRTEQHAQAAYSHLAGEISTIRKRAAARLSKAVTQSMQGLGMAGGRFETNLRDADTPGPAGKDEVAFLVAGHAGSTPRPVMKVASGGELSRIALAIAVTTSQLGSAQTLVFDEVDAGIGGSVAETVGRLMKQLGEDRQVLAVTHLPQVAACADHHLVVSKQSTKAGTESQVVPVAGEQRIAEVARMLGGEHLSGTTLAHARELLR